MEFIKTDSVWGTLLIAQNANVVISILFNNKTRSLRPLVLLLNKIKLKKRKDVNQKTNSTSSSTHSALY